MIFVVIYSFEITNFRKDIIKTALGYAPVFDTHFFFGFLYLIEYVFWIKILQRHLVNKLAVELPELFGLWKQLAHKLFKFLMNNFLLPVFICRRTVVFLFHIFTVQIEMVASSVKCFELTLSANTPDDALVHDTYSVA